MKIETQHNIEDKVFFLFKDAVRQATIKSIDISIAHESEINITYTIKKNPAGSMYTLRFDECELFSTKQGLLESL